MNNEQINKEILKKDIQSFSDDLFNFFEWFYKFYDVNNVEQTNRFNQLENLMNFFEDDIKTELQEVIQ